MATSKIDKEFAAIQTCLNALEPLEDDRRAFALQTILCRLGAAAHTGVNGPAVSSTLAGASPPAVNVGGMTPREFLRLKRPVTDAERITVLAYYLTRNRGTPHFKTQDLTA